MDIAVNFAGGLKVDATAGEFTINTDQSKLHGGEGSAPEPYTYFLASIATCAGFFVLRFCQTRELSTAGIKVTLRNDWNPQLRVPDNIYIDIEVPADFPEKYYPALVRAVNECSVKKTIVHGPNFETAVKVAE